MRLCEENKKNENPQPDKSNYIYRNSFNLFISFFFLSIGHNATRNVYDLNYKYSAKTRLVRADSFE